MSKAISDNLYANVSLESYAFNDDYQINEGKITILDAECYLDEYKNYLKNVFLTINELENNANIVFTGSLLYCEKTFDDIVLNNSNSIFIYSYDKNDFKKDRLSIEFGDTFDDVTIDDNDILVNDSLLKNIDGAISNIVIGDDIYIKYNNDISYKYNVIGIFKNDNIGTLSDEIHYPKYTGIITSINSLIDLSSDNLLYLTKPSISIKNNDFTKLDDLITQLENIELLDIDGNRVDISFRYNIDDSLVIKLENPLENANKYLKLATLITIILMSILLFNLINYIYSKRLKELNIFYSLGQFRIKNAIMFFLEILICSTISFIPACIISSKIGLAFCEKIIDNYLSRQETIATISNIETNYNVISYVNNEYQSLLASYNFNNYLSIYIGIVLIIFISFVFSLIIFLILTHNKTKRNIK